MVKRLLEWTRGLFKPQVQEYEANASGRDPQGLQCPSCGGRRWVEGPSGGLSTNIACAGCFREYNHSPFGLDSIDRSNEDFLHIYGIDRRTKEERLAGVLKPAPETAEKTT